MLLFKIMNDKETNKNEKNYKANRIRSFKIEYLLRVKHLDFIFDMQGFVINSWWILLNNYSTTTTLGHLISNRAKGPRIS